MLGPTGQGQRAARGPLLGMLLPLLCLLLLPEMAEGGRETEEGRAGSVLAVYILGALQQGLSHSPKVTARPRRAWQVGQSLEGDECPGNRGREAEVEHHRRQLGPEKDEATKSALELPAGRVTHCD